MSSSASRAAVREDLNAPTGVQGRLGLRNLMERDRVARLLPEKDRPHFKEIIMPAIQASPRVASHVEPRPPSLSEVAVRAESAGRLPGQFVLKDIVLLGAAVWSFGEALRAVSRTPRSRSFAGGGARRDS
jgi:hypothetical protein